MAFLFNMDYLEFCKNNNIKLENYSYESLSKKDIDKLLYNKTPNLSVDNQCAIAKNLIANCKLTNKQFIFITSLNFYIERFYIWSFAIKNKNLNFMQFKMLFNYNVYANPIEYIFLNNVEISTLNKNKLAYLLDMMLTKFKYVDRQSNIQFKNILNQRLTLEQCNNIMSKFEDNSLILNDFLKAPNISKKTKNKLFEQYVKKEIFK